ncbi:hypothetical protein CLV47_1356 [Antricoccus suffuscus]|uniref:Uncharacterized protein n=1 Tax=Antricoccus suffuscus TaxID=1629062 RepID=A0A2T0YYM8_9ACTN|nr:hypothetical protein CLV47_1356 [Antricoccus suffuscus]
MEALFTSFLAIFAVLILGFSFSAVYRLFIGQR